MLTKRDYRILCGKKNNNIDETSVENKVAGGCTSDKGVSFKAKWIS